MPSLDLRVVVASSALISAGLGWIEDVIIPHADGQLPPYPLALINRTVDQYGSAHRLLRLADDQALRVDATGARIVTS